MQFEMKITNSNFKINIFFYFSVGFTMLKNISFQSLYKTKFKTPVEENSGKNDKNGKKRKFQ